MPLTNDSWHEERLLIDGALVDAEGGATYDNVNPANEEVIGRAADASKGDLEQAIAASRRAFDETEWSRDVGLRVRCLRQLHQSLPTWSPLPTVVPLLVVTSSAASSTSTTALPDHG